MKKTSFFSIVFLILFLSILCAPTASAAVGAACDGSVGDAPCGSGAHCSFYDPGTSAPYTCVADGSAAIPGGLSGNNQSSGFVPLAPIPGLTEGATATETGLANFLNNLYKYLIGVAGVLAVIMIIWGGLEISTQDSISKHNAGKERITEAIIGLLLVLSPVLVFSIINPSILNLSISLDALDTKSGSSVGGNTPLQRKICAQYSDFRLEKIPQNKYCKDVLGAGWVNVDDECAQNLSRNLGNGAGYTACGLDKNYQPPAEEPRVSSDAFLGNFFAGEKLPAKAWCYTAADIQCYKDQNSCTLAAQQDPDAYGKGGCKQY